MSVVEEAIKDKLTYEKLLTQYTYELKERSSKDELKVLADFRKFSLNTLEESDIFYIGNMTEMIIPKYIEHLEDFGVISPTNKKPIFNNRWVIPIKNEKGLVQNLVGYTPDAHERYIYGTALYYRRRDTLYGLENLYLAYEMGYAILVEGITDAIRLKSLGYRNTFAMCGTHKSDYILRQLNRCRHGVIKIPDRDNAGLKASKNWKFNRSITLYTNFKYKDIDEMLREEENIEWFNEYMRDCINWILEDTHDGRVCPEEYVTIL